MAVIPDERRRLVLNVARPRIGVRVKVQMPNPSQPGAMMTLGVLQLSTSQWRCLETCLQVGADSAGVKLTIDDTPQTPRAKERSAPLTRPERTQPERTNADMAHWSTLLGRKIAPDEPFT